ncbi:hypothetical protein [Sulfitobacter dubius]|uniref:hypothetical protein n=1 Tax=Sulfitobacter dubius TaxID=218673 RepID=UPI0022AF4250|nr:hypothetical protein [Sulfitobacter dubius]MCZ4367047.1 hypothetical protein [Sulfitobacter dubius]
MITATEIADLLSAAEWAKLDQRAELHNRVRYLAKKGLLRDAQTQDNRGTLAFPNIEIYRAAIFVALLELSMDAKTVSDALLKADRSFLPVPVPSALDENGAGYHFANSGLHAAVRGVQSDENWLLEISSLRSGINTKKQLMCRFVCRDVESPVDEGKIDRAAGRRPSATKVRVNLNYLFEGLPNFR